MDKSPLATTDAPAVGTIDPSAPATAAPLGVRQPLSAIEGAGVASVLDRDATHSPPSLVWRLFAVWARHWRVYSSTLVANALPAFVEPVLFLVAVGLGLGQFVTVEFDGVPFAAFMGPGVLAMTAMYTSFFETTFGAYVRHEYQNVYTGMLCTPIKHTDCFWGEALFCGTKGVIFTTVVLGVFSVFGAINGWVGVIQWTAVFVPIIGAATAILFAGAGFITTAFVKNLNNFNIVFTGVVTPMVFFSGMLFPVSTLPVPLQWVAYVLPIYHVTEIQRALLFGIEVPHLAANILYVAIVTPLTAWLGVHLMIRRVRGK